MGCVIHSGTPLPQRYPPARSRSHRPAAPSNVPGPGSQAPPPAATVPTQTPFDEPPAAAGRPERLRAGIALGRPRDFRPGAHAAYWIWQGPRGGWRLRTTTQNRPHVFRGRVQGVTGPIEQLHPTRTEYGDRMRRSSQGWVFSFTTTGHADGFTFHVGDQGCVRFDLKLDGGAQPLRIFIGRRQTQPASSHFVLCPNTRKR